MKRITLILLIALTALVVAGCDDYSEVVAEPDSCEVGDYQLYDPKVYAKEGAPDIAFDCEAALSAGIGMTQQPSEATDPEPDTFLDTNP